MARSFDHQAIRAAAAAMGELARKPAQAHWLRGHLDSPISAELTLICDAFVELQDQRNKADYDMSMSFARLEAHGFVNLARNAHSLWPAQRATHNARAFMLASARLLRAR